jgi:hypothetical protein
MVNQDSRPLGIPSESPPTQVGISCQFVQVDGWTPQALLIKWAERTNTLLVGSVLAFAEVEQQLSDLEIE